MKRIGIISDTHGYWDDKYEYYLGNCDEICHQRAISRHIRQDNTRIYRPNSREYLILYRCVSPFSYEICYQVLGFFQS